MEESQDTIFRSLITLGLLRLDAGHVIIPSGNNVVGEGFLRSASAPPTILNGAWVSAFDFEDVHILMEKPSHSY